MTSTLISPLLTASRPPVRCVIYLRISKDSAGLGLGVERQRSECVQLAAARGLDVLLVLTENDTSATKGRGDRKEYRKLLAMLAAGEVDVVLCWAQDRLLREPLEMEALIELAESHPFTIDGVVDRGTDLATASGRRNARMNVADAKGETERKSERQRSASMQRAMAGRPPARRAFGYEPDGSINEAEAAEVRDAFSRYVAGAGAQTIMKEWNARGVFNTAGSPWTPAGFRSSILRNPRYISERWIDHRAKGKIFSTYVGPGSWEPLIGEEIFRAAQARLDALAALATHGSAKKHLGVGLYVCGECSDGSSVRANHTQSSPGPDAPRTLMYLCAVTGRTLGMAGPIDAHVDQTVMAYLRRPENKISHLLADDRDVAAVAAANTRVAALELRLKGLEDALADADDDDGPVKEQIDAFVRVSAAVNAKLKVAKAEQARLGQRSALALLEGAPDPGQAWHDMGIIEKSKVASALGTITVRRGAGRRQPFDFTSVTVDFFKNGTPAIV